MKQGSLASGPGDCLEQALERRGFRFVAGVDEAGRGSLAGPVAAAAVVLLPGKTPAGIDDSKKLSAKMRQELARELKRDAWTSVAFAGVDAIARLNILHATMQAMRQALEWLPEQPHHALIDGNRIPPDLPMPATAVVKGDTISLSIAAASIVAKVERDRIMRGLGDAYPDYGWSRNAGYATAEHLAALRRFGPTPHHRQSFAPVREAAARLLP